MIMVKTTEQIQAELDREIAYTRKVNDKNARLMEENKELKKRLAKYEHELSIIKRQLNECAGRKADRKRIATKEIITRGFGVARARIIARKDYH